VGRVGEEMGGKETDRCPFTVLKVYIRSSNMIQRLEYHILSFHCFIIPFNIIVTVVISIITCVCGSELYVYIMTNNKSMNEVHIWYIAFTDYLHCIS
jgi:hypothetical protein